jgi:hypothetical protein
MVPLYTLYTPSHQVLFDRYFLPTLPDDVELRAEFFDNPGNGYIHDISYWRGIVRKVEIILDAIENNWGSVFIWCDVDAQFFGSFAEWVVRTIRRHDIVFQIDAPGPSICAGVFFCRGNEATRWLWQQALDFVQVPEYWREDQMKIREILLQPTIVRAGFLPTCFIGGGTFTGKLWQPGDDLPIPRNILIHHANFTCGISNKMAQCAYVRERVERGDFGTVEQVEGRFSPGHFNYDL